MNIKKGITTEATVSNAHRKILDLNYNTTLGVREDVRSKLDKN